MIKREAGMTMRYPAIKWQDALPTGSGIVGALVYGNIQNDTILLNHDGLYYPTPPPPQVDVSDQLREVRRLIARGDDREAVELMSTTYTERTEKPGGASSMGRAPYQPFCAVKIGMITDGPFRSYRRGVDFTSGRAWVEWTDNAATFTRETFVSRDDDGVFIRVRSSVPGTVSCRLSLTKARDTKNAFFGTVPEGFHVETHQLASAESRTLSFRGTYPTGYRFGAIGVVGAEGGDIRAEEDALVITAAHSVTLKIGLHLDQPPKTAEPMIRDALDSPDMTFDAAFSRHARLHEALFNRVSLSLGSADPRSN